AHREVGSNHTVVQHGNHERLGSTIVVGPNQIGGHREVIDAGNGGGVVGTGSGVGGRGKHGQGPLAFALARNGNDRVAGGFVGRKRGITKIQAATGEVGVNNGQPGVGDASQGRAVHGVLGH